MQTIVFIGSNKSGTSREALNISTAMGYYTVLLTNRSEFVKQQEEFQEVHRMVYVENLMDKELVLSIIKELEEAQKQICAVISFIDPVVSFAARISAELGLYQISTDALATMEEKTLFRDQLKVLPVSPRFTVYDGEQSILQCVEEYYYYLPLILKSPVSNGSKDVLLVETSLEFKEGLNYLNKKFPTSPILIEEYLIGTQYLIEVIVKDGHISMVAIIEQEILSGERFIITGYRFPAVLEHEAFEDLHLAVTSIIQALGLVNGTCHLEMRLINGVWKLIEINPRMSGGAMNKIIQEGTGINLVKETLKLFLGEELNLEPTLRNHVFAKFLTINSRGRLIKVTGKIKAASYDGVKEVFVKPRKGAILTKPYSLGDRYAYVIASADTPEKAEEIALTAAKEIKFYLEPL
ncbi:ATP-grasp domain-containing protein [Bacillus sp. sid0103]|uniref:ATP-grasp domain-containing protein n=1 Tax=Bacillus sp. sid0103 TaxID=2856337 RepID=UPI001C4867D1|nr:ATP-grasp domain-containing protein [Bacillus sp. sid0103]MBV7508018.1 ATP-grasp domain-containing protein [Bacillus sp. sid0103]